MSSSIISKGSLRAEQVLSYQNHDRRCGHSPQHVFFSLSLGLCSHHHTANLSFACYTASPEQRGNRGSSLLRRLGLENQAWTVYAKPYCCLSCLPSNCLDILWHLPQQWTTVVAQAPTIQITE